MEMIKKVLKSEILNEFISKDYLDYNNLVNIKKIFLSNNPKSIKLDGFFKEDKYKFLQKEIHNLKFKKEYKPLSHSFSRSELGSKFKKLIQSEEFKTFISFITETEFNQFTSNSFMLAHKDYSLLKDDFNKNFLEANFFFTNWKEEFGGYLSYFKDEELLRITPFENSLTLVYVENGLQNFVKYLNVNSAGKRDYFVKVTLR